MKIVLLNKTCKYHNFVFATVLISGNNQKPNSKIPQTFCTTQLDSNLQVGRRKYMIPQLELFSQTRDGIEFYVAASVSEHGPDTHHRGPRV